MCQGVYVNGVEFLSKRKFIVGKVKVMTSKGAFRASVAFAVLLSTTLVILEKPSFAQAGGGEQIVLEEITVTARRREENLMEISHRDFRFFGCRT